MACRPIRAAGGGGRTRSVAQGGGLLAARGLRVGGARAGKRRGGTPRRRTRDLAKQREARRGTERGVERDRCRRWRRRAPQIGPACDRARRAARRRRTGFAVGGPGSRGDRGGGGRGRVERSAGCSRYRAKPARSGRGAPLLAPRSRAQASYRPRFPGPAADEAAGRARPDRRRCRPSHRTRCGDRGIATSLISTRLRK